VEKSERRNLDGRKLPWRRYAMLPVKKEESCPFRMKISYKKKDSLFYLSRHGSGCEHKGHSKKINVKTSAAHTTKSEIKTVKAMVQYPIKARGSASLFEKLTEKNIYNKASCPPNEKSTGRLRPGHSRRARLDFQKYHLCYKTN
jgi:hypothetical protein